MLIFDNFDCKLKKKIKNVHFCYKLFSLRKFLANSLDTGKRVFLMPYSILPKQHLVILAQNDFVLILK